MVEGACMARTTPPVRSDHTRSRPEASPLARYVASGLHAMMLTAYRQAVINRQRKGTAEGWPVNDLTCESFRVGLCRNAVLTGLAARRVY